MLLPLATGKLDLDTALLHPPSGAPVPLTDQECALMRFFGEHPAEDLGRDQLMVEVLGYGVGIGSRAVDDAVKRLRAKIERVREKVSSKAA